MPETHPLLLLLLGEAPEPVSRVHGPFAAWYERSAGEPLTVHDGRAGRLARQVEGFGGILISGSAASLAGDDGPAWVDDAAELVVRAHDAGVPVLGVCFGHQLIGKSFGARVARNPQGYEAGTTTVALTGAGRADPLFDGIPDTFQVNQTHFDMVDAPPADVAVLARNDHTEVQAIGVGAHVRGVQFHPEFSGSIMRAYLAARRASLAARDPDAAIGAAADCPESARVIHNFRRHFVNRA